MEDFIGRILDGKYRIIRLLGRGGMGAVYEAEHIILDRHVAVKILDARLSFDKRAVQRFIREGKTASAVDHPNVIDIQDFGREPDGTVFIVMELLRGDTLQAIIEYRHKIPTAHAVPIALQILSALHAAHKQRIVHRDLKPENIYISVSKRWGDHVKLVDFGIAKYLDEADNDFRLTQTGVVLGTPYYLAPEQAAGGKEVDGRIDIWAVGVILYEMLTGRHPFPGENYNEIISKILMESPPPLRDLSPEVPAGLARVVDRALAKEKEARFSSASEMIEALLPFQGDENRAMSQTAIRALRDSIPPFPLGLSGDLAEGETRRNSDAFAETMDSDSFQAERAVSPGRPGYRRWIVVAAGAATFLVAAALLVAGKRPPVLKIQGDVTIEKQASVVPSLPAEPAATAKTPSLLPSHPGSVGEPEDAAQVAVAIVGLPFSARVTVDGVLHPVPLLLAASREPVVLKVSAPGYAPFERAIVPSKNQTLSIELKKQPRKSNARQKKSGGAASSSENGAWRSNPFGSP